MSITSAHEAGVVINSVEACDTFNDVLEYASQNIDEWGNNQVLWDFHLFDFDSIDTIAIRSFVKRAKILSNKRPGLKTALIIDSDLGYGMLRMLQMLSEETFKFTINVFRNSEQALQWLAEE